MLQSADAGMEDDNMVAGADAGDMDMGKGYGGHQDGPALMEGGDLQSAEAVDEDEIKPDQGFGGEEDLDLRDRREQEGGAAEGDNPGDQEVPDVNNNGPIDGQLAQAAAWNQRSTNVGNKKSKMDKE